MSSEIAIKVKDLSKCFHIYEEPRDRLKQFLLPRLQSATGKPVQKYFREFWALKDINFEVNRGETVGIVGCNGSGKSTLLQLICGTLTPTGGSIETRGRIAALLELGSGFNPEFTGIENIYLNGSILGLSVAEIESRFDDIVAFADIGDFINRPVKTYSSGMYVRLAFAVQAMVDPDILVVDEALAVGDEKFQRKCFARLEELKSAGTSILFVSHSAESIIALCQKTLLLDRGSRLMYGVPADTVRVYQRLLYAPSDKRDSMVERILAESQKFNVIEQDPSSLLVQTLPDNKDFASMEEAPNRDYSSNDSYDPGLVPETKITYPQQGARISSIQIRNSSDQIVNILQSGNVYRFIVSGDFTSNCGGVYFGVHIKTVSGIEVTGQRFPADGKFVDLILNGQMFKMEFAFHMNLLPGTYFAGGGVWSRDEPHCLNRIIDAIMFRVVPQQVRNSFGYVDLMSTKPKLELHNMNANC